MEFPLFEIRTSYDMPNNKILVVGHDGKILASLFNFSLPPEPEPLKIGDWPWEKK